MKKRFFRVTIEFLNTTVIATVCSEKDPETFTGIIKAFAIAQNATKFNVIEADIISDDELFHAMSQAL